jgi:hypothetical protein
MASDKKEGGICRCPRHGSSEEEGEFAETLEGEPRRWLEGRRGCRCL